MDVQFSSDLLRYRWSTKKPCLKNAKGYSTNRSNLINSIPSGKDQWRSPLPLVLVSCSSLLFRHRTWEFLMFLAIYFHRVNCNHKNLKRTQIWTLTGWVRATPLPCCDPLPGDLGNKIFKLPYKGISLVEGKPLNVHIDSYNHLTIS